MLADDAFLLSGFQSLPLACSLATPSPMAFVFPVSLDNGGDEGSILPLWGLVGGGNMETVRDRNLRETGARRTTKRKAGEMGY